MKKSQLKKKGSLLALLLIFGAVGAFIQNRIINVEADVIPIVVGINEMSFGIVFPGENITGKEFTISLAGDETESTEYKISKERSDENGDSCEDNPETCIPDLCPYITPVLVDTGEADTINGATLSPGSDTMDRWKINLAVPAIEGYVAQSFVGTPTGEEGLHGCRISVDVEDGGNGEEEKGSISGHKYNDENQDGSWDEGEEGLIGWEVQLIGCPYAPLEDGERMFISKSSIVTDPEPGLSGYCSIIATTTTDADGYYMFDDLSEGDYGVNEVDKNDWQQIYPESGKYYYLDLAEGEDISSINFFNHYSGVENVCGNGVVESEEECDDGNTDDGDGCSSVCEIEEEEAECGNGTVEGDEECDDGNVIDGDGCSSTCAMEEIGSVCGNGIVENGEICDDGNLINGDGCESNCVFTTYGGGGGGTVRFKITEEKAVDVTYTSAKITWRTNKKSDSRVVCSANPEGEDLYGDEPNYGYDTSTETFDTGGDKTMWHSVELTGLDSNTQYSCRAISSTGGEKDDSSQINFVTEKEYTEIGEDLWIYDLSTQNITQTSFDSSWKTNKDTNTCVVYGASSIATVGLAPYFGYTWGTSGCGNLINMSTEHQESIGALNACTTYYYRIIASDGSQRAISDEQRLKTVCKVPTVAGWSSVYNGKGATVIPQISSASDEKEYGEEEEEITEEEGTVKEAETCKVTECEDTDTGMAKVKCIDPFWCWLLLIIIILLLMYIWKKRRDEKKKEEELNSLKGGI